MKKRLTALVLSVAMLLSMLVLTVSAAEDDPAVGLSFVSSNATLVAGEFDHMFDGNASTYCAAKNTVEGTVITAKLAAPTVISKVTITMHKSYSNRSYTAVIEASADGYNWVQIAQNNTAYADNNGSLVFPLAVTDTNVYSYIRFVQAANFRNYEPGITELTVNGVTQNSVVDVALVSANGTYDTATYGDAANVFDGDKTTSYISVNKTDGLIVTGMLEDYTVIKQVTVTVDSTKTNRTKNAYIQASVDGETWVQIAQNTTDYSANNGSNDFVLTVTNTTPFRYIRFVQNSGYKNYDVGLAEITVEGVTKSLHANISLHAANPSEAGVNPENVFDHMTTTQYVSKNADAGGAYIAGKLDGRYQITSVALKTFGNYVNRVRDAFIEASVDGETWVQIGTQPLTYEGNGSNPVYVVPVTDTTPYRYVRLVQNSAFKNYEIGLYEIEVKGRPVSLEVTPVESNPSDGRDTTNIFKDNMTDTDAQAANNAVFYGTAKLEKPTQITRVIVRAPAANQGRARYMLVKASVDGETWDTLVTCPYTMTAGSERIWTIDNDQYYSYIRYEQDAACASAGYWFTAGSVLVDGNEATDHEGVMFRGIQIAQRNAGNFAIRFISTTGDVSGYNAIGMEIHATTENGTERHFVVHANEVYTAIRGTVDGVATTIKAGEGALWGGKYVYTVVVEDVPLDCGLTTFDVTPYYYQEGQRVNGVTEQYILNGSENAVPTVFDLKANESMLKVSGRSYELTSGIACDFTASGIEFNAFCAGDLKVTANCSATTYYTVYVNGVKQDKRVEFSAGTSTVTVASDLPTGTYTVKLVKQTHAGHSRSALISLSMNGHFNAAPGDQGTFIEFVGDSITCGYGTVNYPEDGVTYYGTSYYCDATEAFAYKTAEKLGTDYSMVSVSGWAVLEGKDSSIPSIYGKTSWGRGDTAYVPERKADIVVINLGTNDKGYDNYLTDFVSQSVAFVEQIRAMHGSDVTIIWAYGAMMTGTDLTTFRGLLDQIVAQTGILTVQLQYDQSAGNGHPSATSHTASAEILANFIQSRGLLNP